MARFERERLILPQEESFLYRYREAICTEDAGIDGTVDVQSASHADFGQTGFVHTSQSSSRCQKR